MNAADGVIRWSTALAVVGVAAIAAVVSYEHASDLMREHGESGWTGRLTVDGLIYASSMVMLDSARRGCPGACAGVVAARLEHCRDARRERRARPGHGSTGADVAAWPAVVLVGSYKLLTVIASVARSWQLYPTRTLLALSCMPASRVHSGCAPTSLPSPVRRGGTLAA
jgi:hypothetical protein